MPQTRSELLRASAKDLREHCRCLLRRVRWEWNENGGRDLAKWVHRYMNTRHRACELESLADELEG